MKLEVTEDELELLQVMIHKSLLSLPIEIHHSRTADFKTVLKERVSKLEVLLEKVKALQS